MTENKTENTPNSHEFDSPIVRKIAIRELLKNQSLLGSEFSKIIKQKDIKGRNRIQTVSQLRSASPQRKTTISLEEKLGRSLMVITAREEFKNTGFYPMANSFALLQKLSKYRKVYFSSDIHYHPRYLASHQKRHNFLYIYEFKRYNKRRRRI